jgi:hypothetical protein
MVFLSDCGVAALSAMLIKRLVTHVQFMLNAKGGHGPPYASRMHRALHSNKNPYF